jgi:flavin-dependent dehydrogenase
LRCDLLVIGAGISGTAAALSALRHGAGEVWIVEKGERPGQGTSPKIDFAENIGLEETLEELELPIRYRSNRSRWYSPSNRCFEMDSRFEDLWVKRGPEEDSFETLALRRVRKEGGEFLPSSEVVSWKEGRLFLDRAGRREAISAGVVIDASGLDSPLRRSLEPAPLPRPSFKRIWGYGMRGTGFQMEAGIPEIFFSPRYATRSYALLCKDPVDGMGYLILGGEGEPRVSPERLLRGFVEGNERVREVLEGVEERGPIRGTLYVVDTLLSHLSYETILFTGDSALLMDPFLHYGVRPALLSGSLAGEAAAAFLSGRKEALDGYEETLRRRIYPELKRQRRLRRVFETLNERDLERIFAFLIQMKEEGVAFDSLLASPRSHLFPLLRMLGRTPPFAWEGLKLLGRWLRST